MKPDYRDQLAIFNPDEFGFPIHLIGCGGIGSAVLFPLLKLGVHELHVWDDDVVEPHNLPCQLVYRQSDVGAAKVDAAKDFAERQEVDCKVFVHKDRVTPETEFEGVVISGVDSMASRRAIWQAVTSSYMVPLLLDGRIGGEQLELYTVPMSDFDAKEAYSAHRLFDDSHAAPLPCAARTVIHPPTVLAGMIIAQLTLFARKETVEPAMLVHLKTMQIVMSGRILQ